MSFKEFINSKGLPVASTEDLKAELEARNRNKNVFPLDVFHESLKPFIIILNQKLDIPRSYIGLSLLCAYSTAIGSSYVVVTNGFRRIFLPVWACLPGLPNAGKSSAIDLVFEPIYRIQQEFDEVWDELPEDSKDKAPMKTILYRDVHVSTLLRYVMPENPKGMVKYSDELMEWINGMNALSKKEGTDEQFWLSAWNCKPYSGIRAGKSKFVIPKPFVNVIGGIQPSLLPKLFGKDRDTTGFVFRILFALPEDPLKISDPDTSYMLDKNNLESHFQAIRRLYFELKVNTAFDDPYKCVLSKEALKLYNDWVKSKTWRFNQDKSQDKFDKEIESGVLGKIREYILRFSAILHLTDKALDQTSNGHNNPFLTEEKITADVMKRAIKLGEYFYLSALDTYDIVNTKGTAPPEVLIAASVLKRSGGKATYAKIAEAVYGDAKFRQKAFRNVKKWIKEYPKVFNAEARSF